VATVKPPLIFLTVHEVRARRSHPVDRPTNGEREITTCSRARPGAKIAPTYHATRYEVMALIPQGMYQLVT